MRIYFCSILLGLSPVMAQQDFASLVNPFIGTGGHGHTFPGATSPFGMVQLSPDTRIDGSWDGCSGYHYSDSVIYGFSHTHLSGTGISDYGDVMLMPRVGNPVFTPALYGVKFNHGSETAEAGYYRVKLDNGVDVELTTTTRTGLHRYTFPESDSIYLLMDLAHRDRCTETRIVVESPSRITGYRRSTAWAVDQYVAFVMEFSQPIVHHAVTTPQGTSMETIITDATAKIHFQFKKQAEPLLVKVALSSVSPEGAVKNLEAEQPGWNFTEVRNKNRQAWNTELSKVNIQVPDNESKTIFYSALYHCMIHPSTASDVDGQYRGMDKKIHSAQGYTHYTIFSLWDTFRALHPLLTLIDRTRTRDFITSFMHMYEQGGRLPVWELASNETDCMIGYHSVSVMADAVAKGIWKENLNLMLDAMVKSATWNHLGLPAYRQNGVITVDDEPESVSKTLEYAYDDWCIAQVALQANRMDVYAEFMQRSLYYRNLIDPETGCVRPRKNGGWIVPFDPREVNNHFTEANAWQYSFFMPHDVSGHVEMLGGEEALEKKLDQLFTEDSHTTGREQADITGLIGQYAHGNEPSHHMAYLYSYIGKPEKTHQRVHQILTDLYHNNPDGLSGNEDCGQMSAWYVLSALGLYQVTPGSTTWVLTEPLVTRAEVQLESGKTITIEKLGKVNGVVQSITRNDKTSLNAFITDDDLQAGGTLRFHLDASAESNWGRLPENRPLAIASGKATPIPSINATATSFTDSLTVSITATENMRIYFTMDASTPTATSTPYQKSFNINSTTTVKAIAIDEQGYPSKPAAAHFVKRTEAYTIEIFSTYSKQYSAGGDEGLIDGIRGTLNWRKGEWQGYQGQDFEAVLDLKEVRKVTSVGGGFLQDTRAWILMPTQVEFYGSADKRAFCKLGTVSTAVRPEDYAVQMKDAKLMLRKTKARYIKIVARNFGKLPPWHQGHPYSGDAYIFVDEIWAESEPGRK